MVADGGELLLKRMNAFGCLGMGCHLVVIEAILIAHKGGREVGHHHIGTSLDAHEPALGVDGVEGGSRRDERLGEHEPEDGVEPGGEVGAAGGMMGEGSVVMRHKGPEAYHLWLEVFDELDVFDQMVHGLPRAAHHDAGAHLIAELLERLEALQPRGERHGGGVQGGVVCRVVRLVAKQIAVGSSAVPAFIYLTVPFAQRQGDGAIGPRGPDVGHEFLDPQSLVARQFAALQHKGAETDVVTLLAALHHLVVREHVAGNMGVALANAAVQAVVAAHIGDLDKSSHKDAVPEVADGHLLRLLAQIGHIVVIRGGEQRRIVVRCEVVRVT